MHHFRNKILILLSFLKHLPGFIVHWLRLPKSNFRPHIKTLSADTTVIIDGNSALLSWEISHAFAVKIKGGKWYKPIGSALIFPHKSNPIITVKAYGRGDSKSKTISFKIIHLSHQRFNKGNLVKKNPEDIQQHIHHKIGKNLTPFNLTPIRFHIQPNSNNLQPLKTDIQVRINEKQILEELSLNQHKINT